MSLRDFGWNSHWEKVYRQSESTGLPGRVVSAQHGLCELWTQTGVAKALARCSEPLIAGDWVLWRTTEDGSVVADTLLPRKSVLSRRAAGRAGKQQILAVNTDTVLIVSALDGDLNPARLERYLASVWESGASPVLVLTKPDLHPNPEDVLEEVGGLAPGVSVHLVNALRKTGLDQLEPYTRTGMTTMLTGSSGVGKSTLINALSGQELQATGAVRSQDGKGRHTTTDRVLLKLPGGGVLMDTPGMRELGLWVDEEVLGRVFPEFEAFTGQCRFRDCTHRNEPGCAVLEGLENGTLERRRYDNYHKMQREVESLELRSEPHKQRARDRALHKTYKKMKKQKYGSRW